MSSCGDCSPDLLSFDGDSRGTPRRLGLRKLNAALFRKLGGRVRSNGGDSPALDFFFSNRFEKDETFSV